MRSLSSAVTAALSLLICSSLMSSPGQAQNLSITNYQFVSQTPVTATQWQVVYKADVVNGGGPLASVTAKLTSLNPFSFRTISGKDFLNFAPVPANSQVTSSNTFSILVDRTQTFSFNNLQWAFTSTPVGPMANAGANQTASVGSTVTLNGSGSTNPSGIGTLTYAWTFQSRPIASRTTLSNPSGVMPTFVVDVAGTYVIQLIVSNGTDTSTATTTVSTSNTPPVANAGPNQTVTIGSKVTLNGAGSTDFDGNPLTYAWILTTVPNGSNAALTGANTVSPTFVADKIGGYQAQLIVNDGMVNSTASVVMITSTDVAPIANAGANQVINVGATVQLDGSGSTDVNGNPLTYSWTLITLPSGSAAVLNNPNIVNPTFVADLPGTYVAQLIVNDGTLNSTAATVTLTTNSTLPPVVNAGNAQMVTDGTLVTLHGTASDPKNLPLTLQWTITVKPAGSTATLTNATSLTPTFIADLAGTYVVQLIANNGTLSSTPSTVTITTTSVAPVANAGPAQGVTPGATVTLDGSGSTDSNHNTLTYAWTLLSAPAGSSASLSGANTVSPSFVADVLGAYVVQLVVNDGYESSQPATVMITASTTPTISLTPSPVTIGVNSLGTLVLTLSAPAGPNGQIIHLLSNNSNVASVSATAVVGAGGTTTSISVQGLAVGSATISASASGYTSASATVNVNVPTLTLTLDSNTVGLNHTINGTFTLNTQAPPTGVNVNLNSNPSGFVDVEPPSVKITSGNTSGTFTITGLAVGQATITAASPGFSTVSAGITVTNAGSSFSFTPPSLSLAAGTTQNLTLTLSSPAPSGLIVNLSSTNTGAATVPASLAFPVNTTSLSVPVTGVGQGTATINASATNFANATASVTVTPATVLGAIVLPTSVLVAPNQSATFSVALSVAAPANGVTVSLVSANTAAVTIAPASVFIAAGQTTPSSQPQVTGVAFGSSSISATATSFTSASQTVQVSGTIGLTPATLSINGAGPQNLTLTLSSPAPAGTVINLSSSNTAAATVPATVSFATGATTVQVPVTGVSTGSATIHASALPRLADTTASVTVTFTKDIFLPSNVTVGPGLSVPFPVTLAQPAPANGVFVSVSSLDPNTATVSTANVFIPGGQTTSSSVLKLNGVAYGSTKITASAFNLIGDTETVVVGASLTYFPSPIVINGTATQNVVLSLAVPAPAGGLTVNLKVDDTTVATAPATATFAANASSVSIQVTGVNAAGGTTTIHASSSPLLADTTATINVLPPGAITLPSNVQLAPGQTAPFPVMLGTPAPLGGVSVMLTSTDPTKVVVSPASVTIAGGQTQPQTQPTVTALNLGNVTINAVANGYTSASQPVKVTATINFVPSSANIIGTASTNLTLNLSAPAPAGLVITLSASPSGIVTIPATVTFATGATSVTVPVTGASTGTTTVTASAAASNIAPTTSSITVAPATPTTITINGGGTQSAAVGTAFGTTLAVTVKDQNGAGIPNTPVVFTAVAGGSGQTGTFSNSTGTITVNTNGSGVASAGAFTANGKIGAYTVTATAGPAPAATFNLTNTPGAASKFSVSAPANATSGAAFAITVTAQDSFGNTATGYAGSVKITSSDAQATLPANAGLSNGVGTFNVTLKNGGNQTVTATDTVTSSITGVSGAIAVAGPLPATHFSISAPSSVTQGASFNITVTALDTNNGTASTYAGTVHFTSSDGTATLPGNATLTNGVGTFPVTLNTTTSTQTITATDTVTSSITGSTGAITVAAGANHFVVSAPSSAKAGTSFQFTVTAQNAQNTTIPSYSGTVHFTSTDAAATLPADAALSNGVGTFNATLKTLGNFTITATDKVTSSITGVSGAINVGPGNAAKFAISAPSTSKTGVPFNITVTAQDSFNNTATAYTGTVHFTSSDGAATLPANATLTSGTGTFQVTLNTISPPTQTITAVDTVTSTIQGTSAAITVGPAISVTALAGTPQTTQINQDFPTQFKVIVQDGNGNPVNGAFVTFTAPSTGASGAFAGSLTATRVTDATGQVTAPTFTANGTKGSYVVMATVNNASPGVFNLTNISMVLVSSTTVGQNLQSSILVTLPQSSASASTITLTSSDPTKLLVYNGATTPPGASASILINAGDTQGIAYVEGQAGGTGTVTVTATLAGFDNGVSTVTVTNSGFVLSEQSGNGIGASFTAGLGIPVNLVVNSAQLDANGNFVQTQPVRTNFTSTPDGNGGVIITNIPVTVPLQSTNTTVGTISSPVTFNGGDDTQLASFNPVNPGATTVSLQSAGNGFTASPTIGCPSSCMPANQVFITVPNQMISLPNVTVGQNLEAAATVTLNAPAPGNTGDPNAGVHITLQTSDPHLQFSATSGGTGSSSLVVLAHAGQLQSFTFYIYGLTSSGSAQYTATADSGYAPPQVPGTVTFTPSAFVISGPSQQPGTGINTTNMAAPSPVYLYSVQLNSSGGILAYQPIAGAQNVPITLAVSAGTPGSIASPVAFAAGTGVAQTTFTPQAGQNGLGSLTVGEPAGFTAPASNLQTISVTVNVPGLAIQGATVGHNLQVQGSFSLGQFAPAGGVNVTLTAQSGVLLSSDPTMMGSSTLVVNVPAGGFNGIFYVQAVGTAGATPTYTASAPGYRAPLAPATVTIVASAPYVGGPNAFQQGASNPTPVTHGSTQGLTLYMALVDGNGNATDHQALAGGMTMNITIVNTNPSAGTVTPASPIAITGGTDGVALTFNAASGGAGQSTSISASGGATPVVKLNVI